jgi:hypothetical protein
MSTAFSDDAVEGVAAVGVGRGAGAVHRQRQAEQVGGRCYEPLGYVLTRLNLYIFEDQRSLLLIWGRKEKVFLHTCLKNSKNTEFHINTA